MASEIDDGDPFKQLDDSIDVIQQKIQNSIERLKALADPDPSIPVSDDIDFEIIQTFAHGVSEPISCSPCNSVYEKNEISDHHSAATLLMREYEKWCAGGTPSGLLYQLKLDCMYALATLKDIRSVSVRPFIRAGETKPSSLRLYLNGVHIQSTPGFWSNRLVTSADAEWRNAVNHVGMRGVLHTSNGNRVEWEVVRHKPSSLPIGKAIVFTRTSIHPRVQLRLTADSHVVEVDCFNTQFETIQAAVLEAVTIAEKNLPAPKVPGAEAFQTGLDARSVRIEWVREFNDKDRVQAILIEGDLVELSYQGESRIVSAIPEHVRTMAAFLYETYMPLTKHQQEMRDRNAKLAKIEAKHVLKPFLTSLQGVFSGMQSVHVFVYYYFYVLCGVCVTLILVNMVWVPGDDLLKNALLGMVGGASFAAANSNHRKHMMRRAVIEADRTMKAVEQIKSNSSFSCPSCGTTKRNGMYKKGLCRTCHQHSLNPGAVIPVSSLICDRCGRPGQFCIGCCDD